MNPRRGLGFALGVLLCACSPEQQTKAGPTAGGVPTAAAIRATRRAFDGAPPVIPHRPVGAACSSCHDERGIEVQGMGFAPPSPHAESKTPGLLARCTQCHVFRETAATFRDNRFTGLAQDLRKGERLHAFAPPVMPHQQLLRENCSSCHTGPAARAEIRTSHPERERCIQCHLPAVTEGSFRRG